MKNAYDKRISKVESVDDYMNGILEKFNKKINTANHIVVYGAGEFGALTIQYCLKHIGIDKLDGCIVTHKQADTPPQIMGISVTELNEFKFLDDTLVIIAVFNKKVQQVMRGELEGFNVGEIYVLSEREFKILYSEVGEMSTGSRDVSIKNLAEIKKLKKMFEEKINNLQYMLTAMPAMLAVHKETFGPYYGAFEGKEVVVCGCGPTLNLYNFDDGRIHIGVNSMLFDENIASKLDYYFNQHVNNVYHPKDKKELEDRNPALEKLKAIKCVKFVGQTIGTRWPITPPYDECQKYDYHVYYNQELTSGDFWPDLRYNFLNGNVSVLYAAVQFALFCRPERIYLVGCDGYGYGKVNYYLKWYDDQIKYPKEYIEPQQKVFYEKHVKLKEFALLAYPHTDVIMVNPRGFKGIYKETVTDENGNIIK